MNVSIIEAIEDKNLIGGYLQEKNDSFCNWKTFLKAVFALQMDQNELAAYKKFTQREKPPEKPFESVYCISGRKSGKTLLAACLGIYICLFEDFWKPYVRPGQKVYLPIIATDKVQARECFNYCEGILKSNSYFQKQVAKPLAWEIELVNSAVIMIRTASFISTRGPLYISAILDELAFFRDENYANPADEIVKGLLPGLIPEGKLIGISSAYARFGFLYEEYENYFGKDDPHTLVWLSDTMSMNPTYDERKIKRALQKDPQHAQADFYSIWRKDLELFIGADALGDVIIPGRRELGYREGESYYGFVDHSGGRQDSAVLCIVHRDQRSGKIIQDVVRERRAPFNPQEVTREFAEVLKYYKLDSVTGDFYSGSWVSSGFEKEGILYQNSELNKSDLYLEFLPLVMRNAVELLDNEKMRNELLSLERRTGSKGKDSVDHPRARGLHDDLANAVAGACVLAAQGEETIMGDLIVVDDSEGPLKSWEKQMILKNNPPIEEKEDSAITMLCTKTNVFKFSALSRKYDYIDDIAREMGVPADLLKRWVQQKSEFINSIMEVKEEDEPGFETF